VCYADVGAPIVILNITELWIAFIPIVVIEAIVIKRNLQSETTRKAVWSAFYANAVTTFVGLPIAYGLYAVIGLLGWEALPVSGGSGGTFSKAAYNFLLYMVWAPELETIAYQIVPVLLLVPAYFLTVYLESLILRREFPRETSERIRQLSRKMNLYSYLFLAIVAIVLPPAIRLGT
jgi:hypothetical protein